MTEQPTSSLIFDSQSESDTDRLGTLLAQCLTEGICIALNGQLGSGKTRFVRSLCIGLSIESDQVNSPTFVLMQLYADGRMPVAHFDTYRLADVDEFLAIGADEFLNNDEYVCLIEWADQVAEVLPSDHLQINIEQTGTNSRRFQLTAFGLNSREILNMLSRRLTNS